MEIAAMTREELARPFESIGGGKRMDVFDTTKISGTREPSEDGELMCGPEILLVIGAVVIVGIGLFLALLCGITGKPW